MLEAVIFFTLGAGLLFFFAWRAVLFIAPNTARIEVETPADATPIPPELDDAWAELKKLGFVLLGAHSEKFWFRAPVVFIDGVHEKEPVVASLTLSRDEQDHTTLWSNDEHRFVITSNFKRPSRETRGTYLSGSIEGASFERLLKVHLRRLPEIGSPQRLDTIEKRVGAARTWFSKSGKPELRQQHALALLWSIGAIGMVCAAFSKLWEIFETTQ
jgi:hypothetical protein